MPTTEEVDKILSLISLFERHPLIAGLLLLAGLAPALFIMHKTYADGRSTFHGVREKKLTHLLTYIDADIKSKQPFSVEQAFYNYYSKLIGFEEIKHLLSFPNPSLIIHDYFWGKRKLCFNEKTQKLEAKGIKNFEIYKNLYFFLFFGSGISLYISAILAFIFFRKPDHLKHLDLSILIFLLSLFLMFIALINNREIYSTERVLVAEAKLTEARDKLTPP